MKESNENFINPDLNEEGFPIRGGVYLAQGVLGPGDLKWTEVDVYPNSANDLCVFNEAGGEDDDACHLPVRLSGLIFGERIRDLD